MVQIRNVPDDIHAEITARAAQTGMSLSDYLLREIGILLKTPPIEDFLDRWAQRPRIQVDEAAADVVRGDRDPI